MANPNLLSVLPIRGGITRCHHYHNFMSISRIGSSGIDRTHSLLQIEVGFDLIYGDFLQDHFLTVPRRNTDEQIYI